MSKYKNVSRQQFLYSPISSLNWVSAIIIMQSIPGVCVMLTFVSHVGCRYIRVLLLGNNSQQQIGILVLCQYLGLNLIPTGYGPTVSQASNWHISFLWFIFLNTKMPLMSSKTRQKFWFIIKNVNSFLADQTLFIPICCYITNLSLNNNKLTI